MLAVDEDALECDFMETYHILDYRELPVQKVALLASGLRDDSRIKMAMEGRKYTTDTLLLASCLDKLALLWWSKTKDAENGINAPPSVFQALIEYDDSPKREIEAFNTGNDFMKRWAELGEEG